MYVFFDAECTQDLARNDGSFGHIPNLICALQMCSESQALNDMETDCEQCGKRTRVFWEDPVGKGIDYFRLSRPFADKIYVILNNSRGYDAQFLLHSFLKVKWELELTLQRGGI